MLKIKSTRKVLSRWAPAAGISILVVSALLFTMQTDRALGPGFVLSYNSLLSASLMDSGRLGTSLTAHSFSGQNYAPTIPVVNATVSTPRDLRFIAPTPQVLDDRHQYALGMIETGNDDRQIGSAGEVSRYQIMPVVWSLYSHSGHFTNTRLATSVAAKHWSSLYALFRGQTRREPTDFDMYVMWNTGYSYYAGRRFKPGNLPVEIHSRARNFANLVKLGGSQITAASRATVRSEPGRAL